MFPLMDAFPILSLPDFKVNTSGLTKRQTKMLNTIQFAEVFSRLMNVMLSRFKWNGLPASCNERALEITLAFYGYALFFNDENIGFAHTPCTLSGPFNIYYESVNRRAYSYNYEKNYTIDDSVLIRGNLTMTPDYLILMNYAPKIADAIRAIDVHTQTLKKPYMVSCEERQKNSVIRALNDIADNEITVLSVPNAALNTLQVLNTGVQSYLGDMWANVKNMFNQVYSALGVANEFTSKKERLVVSESQGEQTPIRHSLESELECRRKACEEINKMFGLNVSVEANQLEQFKEEQIEDLLAKMGQQVEGGNESVSMESD